MPVLFATVSSLPSPNIRRYQLVSNSLINAALCLCCATFFPEKELRLTSWELLRWTLDPLREATDCFRCILGGWCPLPGPPTPPPLLRAASMTRRVDPSLQWQGSDEQEEIQDFQWVLLLKLYFCLRTVFSVCQPVFRLSCG
ncbi:hypothetical protein ILYODFUR_000124 [Ilyodon furcidens]|uniref:Uncharacterized protein n=1 Tax=Ilyodon furcidens TaxID=33524 RepID=A0ABV0V9U7_9TELE